MVLLICLKWFIIGLGNQLVNDVRNGDVHIERIERSDKTPQELVQKVEKFYLDGKNSRILPGIKDVISVKTKEGRTKLRKHLLLSTISEAYQQFREGNDDILSEDMFRKLRPPNVVLMGGSGTHKICSCIHCENPNLMITTSILAKLESFQCLSKDSKQVTPKSLV